MSSPPPAEYHDILLAYKGYCELSPTARVRYAELKGIDVKPDIAPSDPILHEVWRELGDDKFTSRLSRAKVQLVKVPKEYDLSKLEIVYSNDKDCQYVQQVHEVWNANSVFDSEDHDDLMADDQGPAAKKKVNSGGFKTPTPVRKVALNTCSGPGFRLSEKAVEMYAKASKTTTPEGIERIKTGLPRDDPLLIAVINKLDSAASGFCSNIRVAMMPAHVRNWSVMSDEGIEWIAEEHLEWWPDMAMQSD